MQMAIPYANFDVTYILANCKFVLLALNWKKKKMLQLKFCLKWVTPQSMTSKSHVTNETIVFTAILIIYHKHETGLMLNRRQWLHHWFKIVLESRFWQYVWKEWVSGNVALYCELDATVWVISCYHSKCTYFL